MLIYNNPKFSIFFGDLQSSPFKIEQLRESKEKSKDHLMEKIKSTIPELQNYIPLKKLYFLHQIHESYGIIIDSNSTTQTEDCLKKDGDYIITSKQNLGIGTLTADCLPIVFYDILNNVIAIAHAGWRGTVKNIAKVVINDCNKKYGTRPENFLIFFGPSARSCCYEVDEKFFDNIDKKYINTLIERDDKIFFDLPLYNQLLIENCGVKKENINLEYNVCTICNSNFCSYRRKRENSDLAMTIVTLR